MQVQCENCNLHSRPSAAFDTVSVSLTVVCIILAHCRLRLIFLCLAINCLTYDIPIGFQLRI